MFFKEHFGTVLTSVLSLVMGLFMGIAVIIVNHLPFVWTQLFQLWAEIFMIVFVVSLFVPYNAWGDWLAGKVFDLKEGTVGFALVQGIIPSVILNTFNTFICVGQSIFYNPTIPQAARMGIWWHSCISTWWIFFVVSYIASYIAVWIGKFVATHYVKKSNY
ncbi:hypothetical protein [Lactobacillus xujianguonis]|uniref:hypothetical protein n=1 Tax=Lactobacillus xujianguonis TaxID=2495899 RepID=UPI000FDB94BF|nr:hypothetical protein [Lactobacillus xujianguonis]RVU73908.1 hypothetical protein EJK20_05540 [Lactobacillus xujianguonis]